MAREDRGAAARRCDDRDDHDDDRDDHDDDDDDHRKPEAPVAPEGAEFLGWSASANGEVLEGDVATPDLSTTYYAIYKYVDVEGVEYDEIYLQNVYSKLYNDKSLTIGYLGGSVTVGSGATVSGAKSTTAWRALTTKWFKDNFPNATIKEVYGGIGGTGSRFGSYRMTRDEQHVPFLPSGD